MRALLNLGHTFAHAIEAQMGYGVWLHGEAVYIRTDRMFALLIILGALGAAADFVVQRLGAKLVHWEQA